MEQRFLRALRRILDATAFENVGHLRGFEELLQRGEARDARDRAADSVSTAQVGDDARSETRTLFPSSRKVDRDT